MNAICLHHNDADGRASGAIVRRALGPEVALHEINYGDAVPWQRIQASDKVLIVDFSLTRDDMIAIAQGRQLIWIDHHISAIQEMADSASNLPGLRSLEAAACVLCWRYFFPGIPVPHAVLLISDRDTWSLTEPDSGAFAEGLHQKNTKPENDALWTPLLDDDQAAVNNLIEEGRVLLGARLRAMRRFVNSYGYRVSFEGHNTLAVNRRGDGDMGQYIRDLGYTLGYCYVDGFQDGKLKTFVTLFSAEVDVAQIASRFGGGGHRGAAGFSFDRGNSPFPPGSQVSLY